MTLTSLYSSPRDSGGLCHQRSVPSMALLTGCALLLLAAEQMSQYWPCGGGRGQAAPGAGAPPLRSPSRPPHPQPADPHLPSPCSLGKHVLSAYCALGSGARLPGETVTPLTEETGERGRRAPSLGGKIPVGLSEEVVSEAYTASGGCVPDRGVTHAGPGARRKRAARDTKSSGAGAEGEREPV